MTNGDVIRNMTDEELAEHLEPRSFDCAEICNDFGDGCAYSCKYNRGKDFLLKWLKEEAR